jgi:predicted lipoprotein with Yx(FWY)xxD motif
MRKSKINLISVFLALAFLAGCGSSSYSGTSGSKTATNTSASSGESGVVVKTASIPSVGGAVLVNSQGQTLYHLTAEQNGKFICTNSSCVSVWHPLTSTGGTPSGVSSLTTVKRPDGSVQVAYKGEPLYTFAQDAPGEAKGQGFKDVGTWTVVTVGAPSSSSTPTTSTTTTTSSGGGKMY